MPKCNGRVEGEEGYREGRKGKEAGGSWREVNPLVRRLFPASCVCVCVLRVCPFVFSLDATISQPSVLQKRRQGHEGGTDEAWRLGL